MEVGGDILERAGKWTACGKGWAAGVTLASLPDSTTSAGSLASGEDLEEEKNSGACFGAKCGAWDL